jgi:monofunctional biosynthetic peptidoglycan transglycosylase
LRGPSLPFDRSALLKEPLKSKKMSKPARILLGIGAAILGFYVVMACLIFSLRFFNPRTTMVQFQREVEAVLAKRPYNRHYRYVPLNRMAMDIQYAVIAAEDGRFYVHHGFDWIEIQKVLETDMRRKRLGRGASTITQQLVKNLFLGTERSIIKKGLESTLVPLFELLLSKDRILELYLNVIEWGPGVFGAEAASEHWYHIFASNLSREQCARLAAVIPNPLRRTPERETEYAEEILDRMKKMGW